MTLIGRNMEFAKAAGATLTEAAEITRAIRTEVGDAPAGTSTRYTMTVGDTFNGTLVWGDADWVRVQLQPGSYVISLDSRGASGVSDPYLRVMNEYGIEIAQNDDGDGLNSRLVLNVTEPGTYYLEAGSYGFFDWGAYSLQLTALAPRPQFTMAQIAHQLTDGFWEADGQSRRAFDVGQGDVLNVDLSGLTAQGRQLASMALSVWEQVTGITFNRNPGSNATVHITFDDSDWGAWSSLVTSGDRIVSSRVNVGLDWLMAYGTGYNSYSYHSYIHEIGHALGLGHAGNYNGSGFYGLDNHYRNDSWQASVMSYFDQQQNYAVDASFAFATSAMMADILAIQQLYGPTSIRTGNNTYGETTNAGPSYATIAGMLRDPQMRDDITFTIFDQGGVDTLNLGTDTHNQRISLAPGTVSDAYGLIGNISIAQGTLIENMQAGRGHDLVVGNGANNTLRGGGGNDTLRGNNGNDTLIGGNGHDRLEGGAGADSLVGGLGNDTYVTDGRDQIVETAGQGIDTVRSSVTLKLGANLENLVLVSNKAQDGGGNALANRLTGNAHANRLDGFQGNDTLRGNNGNDTLNGGNGNDWLDGGAGADRLVGGRGNDTYVTDGRDQIVETAGQGIDTVRSSVTLKLGANLENLVLVSNKAQDGGGNALANRLTGNAHANRLDGFQGNDTLLGRGGNDTLNGGNGHDWLEGGVGADMLIGGSGNDTMHGGAGADHFVFHRGRDVVRDFKDNQDTLHIDDALWGGGGRSVAEVLKFAHVSGGNTVFDFGNGNVLTLNGFANIAALQDDLIVI